MSESRGSAEGHRHRLLEMLRLFEEAAERIHPETDTAATHENIVRFQEAVDGVHRHLSEHRASKETAEWPQLPDTDPEIAAFAVGLKEEHQELLDELSKLARSAAEVESAPDRSRAAALVRRQSRVLALRIAKHAGEAEAPLGNY